MAANTLAVTYADLRAEIGYEAGWGRNPATQWTSENTSDGAKILKAGLLQFYYNPAGHLWSFLEPKQGQLELHGAYATGTVSVTTGVVTLSGGTFPSWAAQGDVWVDGGYYPVSTRDGNTQVTLVDTSVTGLTGESYSLKHREYDLPDDFGGMVEPFTYRSDQSNWRPLTRINEAQIRSLEAYPEVTGPPSYFCITSAAPTSSQESKARAIFAPIPDGTYSLWYRYQVVPPMLDGSTYVYAHGGAEYADTLRLSVIDKTWQMVHGSSERHGAFLESLQASVALDKKKTRPKTYGFGVYSDGYDWIDLDRYRRRGDFTFDTSNL